MALYIIIVFPFCQFEFRLRLNNPLVPDHRDRNSGPSWPPFPPECGTVPRSEFQAKSDAHVAHIIKAASHPMIDS